MVLFNIGPVTPNRINGLFDSITKPRQSPTKMPETTRNLGSEDTVGRPKNYQGARKAPNPTRVRGLYGMDLGSVTLKINNQQRESLFTFSGALLFSSTKTAKFQNPCISGHGAFACILYHVSTQEIHRQNLKRHRFSRHVLDNL